MTTSNADTIHARNAARAARLKTLVKHICQTDIYGNITPLMEYVLQLSKTSGNDPLFPPEAIEEATANRCPYCGSRNTVHEGTFENNRLCNACKKNFEQGALPKVYTWWHVNDTLAKNLRGYGALVLTDGCASYWGRCTPEDNTVTDDLIYMIADNWIDAMDDYTEET